MINFRFTSYPKRTRNSYSDEEKMAMTKPSLLGRAWEGVGKPWRIIRAQL